MIVPWYSGSSPGLSWCSEPGVESPGHGGFPTKMPLGVHFEVLGSGKAPNICVLLQPRPARALSGVLFPRGRYPSGAPYLPKSMLTGLGRISMNLLAPFMIFTCVSCHRADLAASAWAGNSGGTESSALVSRPSSFPYKRT